MNNFFLIILDGVGIGELSDAADYGDEGSDTLGNISKALGGLNLPNLEKMGLGNIKPIEGIKPKNKPLASFGKLKEVSKGKDSITGHWELGGINNRPVIQMIIPDTFEAVMIEITLPRIDELPGDKEQREILIEKRLRSLLTVRLNNLPIYETLMDYLQEKYEDKVIINLIHREQSEEEI